MMRRRVRGVPLVLAISVAVLLLAAPSAFAQDGRCDGEKATIVGTNRAEVLRGTAANDVIIAGGGNDAIDAGDGSDVICAGPGNDLLIGGAGNDRLFGGAGRDQVVGGTGDDRVDLGPGDDRPADSSAVSLKRLSDTGVSITDSSTLPLILLGLVALAGGSVLVLARVMGRRATTRDAGDRPADPG